MSNIKLSLYCISLYITSSYDTMSRNGVRGHLHDPEQGDTSKYYLLV